MLFLILLLWLLFRRGKFWFITLYLILLEAITVVVVVVAIVVIFFGLTNVNLIVGICSRCSQEATFKVLSKLGQ